MLRTIAHTPPTHRHAAHPGSSPELDAYNAAFDELELDWHWDGAILAEVAGFASEKERICAYLRGHRPHLLKVYDADDLAAHIAEVKARLLPR